MDEHEAITYRPREDGASCHEFPAMVRQLLRKLGAGTAAVAQETQPVAEGVPVAGVRDRLATVERQLAQKDRVLEKKDATIAEQAGKIATQAEELARLAKQQ